jgi:hypothetical protein
MNDITTSDWFRRSLGTALERDPVDALNDAAALVVALQSNLEQVVAEATSKLQLQ